MSKQHGCLILIRWTDHCHTTPRFVPYSWLLRPGVLSLTSYLCDMTASRPSAPHNLDLLPDGREAQKLAVIQSQQACTRRPFHLPHLTSMPLSPFPRQSLVAVQPLLAIASFEWQIVPQTGRQAIPQSWRHMAYCTVKSTPSHLMTALDVQAPGRFCRHGRSIFLPRRHVIIIAYKNATISPRYLWHGPEPETCLGFLFPTNPTPRCS